MGEETEVVETESASLPLTILAGQTVKPGDVVRLEVVSVSDEDGTFEAKYATPSEDTSAIDEAAAMGDSSMTEV